MRHQKKILRWVDKIERNQRPPRLHRTFFKIIRIKLFEWSRNEIFRIRPSTGFSSDVWPRPKLRKQEQDQDEDCAQEEQDLAFLQEPDTQYVIIITFYLKLSVHISH